jgi:membrane-associated phospholipid phosphatase
MPQMPPISFRFKLLFSKGIFGTGWADAVICVVLAIALFLINQIYTLLNHGPAVLHLASPLDDIIPLVPIFAVPYVSLEPLAYLSLVIFLLTNTHLFRSACLAFISALLVSYLFYIFLQSEMIRPALTGSDIFTQMIRQVYATDNPYNCFPSLHTSLSTILAIHWLRAERRIGILFAVWTALIVASTVFVKQHYVADIASGLLLAFSVSGLTMRLLLKKPNPILAPSQPG